MNDFHDLLALLKKFKTRKKTMTSHHKRKKRQTFCFFFTEAESSQCQIGRHVPFRFILVRSVSDVLNLVYFILFGFVYIYKYYVL